MVVWPRFLIDISHCPLGRKFARKRRLVKVGSSEPPDTLVENLSLSPRNLVRALEHSKVCNFPWLHMAHWQLAAVKRTGRAHPAGQLRPRLDKMNGHSSSVPFGHPSNWCRSAWGSCNCRDERGSVALIRGEQTAPPRSWLLRVSSTHCADKGEDPLQNHCGPPSLQPVAHFDLKPPPPNSPSQEALFENHLAEHPV